MEIDKAGPRQKTTKYQLQLLQTNICTQIDLELKLELKIFIQKKNLWYYVTMTLRII